MDQDPEKSYLPSTSTRSCDTFFVNRARITLMKFSSVHFLGTLDEVLFGGEKRLDAQSAMADVSLAAMAGVTAADHERISKFCTP